MKPLPRASLLVKLLHLGTWRSNSFTLCNYEGVMLMKVVLEVKVGFFLYRPSHVTSFHIQKWKTSLSPTMQSQK